MPVKYKTVDVLSSKNQALHKLNYRKSIAIATNVT